MADTQANEAAITPMVVEGLADMPDSTAPMRVALFAADGTAMKQAANVATTGTVEDIVNALVAAGLMAAPSE